MNEEERSDLQATRDFLNHNEDPIEDLDTTRDAHLVLDGRTTVDISHAGGELHEILMGSFHNDDFITTR